MNISCIKNLTDRVPPNAVLVGYQDKLTGIQSKLEHAQSQRSHSRIFIVGFACLLLIFVAAAEVNRAIPLIFSIAPLISFSLALRRHVGLRAMALELAHEADFYERGVNRLTGAWPGKGATGQEFARKNHLYQWDLDILGRGSLFELLCTTRSDVGAERLAAYLLDPAELEEVRSRQSAVKELKDVISLREEIALLGKYGFQDCNSLVLRDWLNMPIRTVRRSTQLFLLASGPICVTLGLLGLANAVTWGRLAPFLVPLVISQIAIVAGKSYWVRPELEKLETLTNEFVVLRQGFDLMQHQHFHSSKLESLVQDVRHRDASSKLRGLERLLSMIHQRKKDWFYFPSFLLAAGTQLVLAVEQWRAEHQEDLKSWLDAWAEFDALNALACYAYEHPTAVFPELVGGVAVLEANRLGHPLLAEDVCVGNDVILNGTTRFYLVSGSNMAGKSTFLRAIGMNAVLASAGAPVRAARARMSVFAIGASISVADSLLEGKSKFLAEVERLKLTIALTQGKLPVLFLIDEILSGTNSRDRRIAAEAIIRSLLAGGAIGGLSTHDLTLTEIADVSGLQGLNMHMDSTYPNDPLGFDYLLKGGVSLHSNALAIVKMIGVTL
jgi:hypothetical protein